MRIKEGWNHNNHYHRLLLKDVPASCTYALDIGCGTGEFTRLLARRAEHVLALDFSPQTLQLAHERSTHVPNIEFVTADAMTWEFLPAQFDYIVSIAALHHMSLVVILLRMKEALAPGGTLVVLDLFEGRAADHFFSLAAIPANLFMQRVNNGHRSAPSPELRAAMTEHYAHDASVWKVTLAHVNHLCHALLLCQVIITKLCTRNVKRNIFVQGFLIIPSHRDNPPHSNSKASCG